MMSIQKTWQVGVREGLVLWPQVCLPDEAAWVKEQTEQEQGAPFL